MRRILLFLFWLFSLAPLTAQVSWTRDSAIYRIRDFDEQELLELRKSDRYHYEQEAVQRKAPGIWELLKDWIESLLKKYGFDHEPQTVQTFTEIVVWVFVGVALLITSVFLFRNKHFVRLFRRSDPRSDEAIEFLSYTGSNSNLEAELQQAEQEANYPLALRFLYIRCLRILEDAMLIDYKKDKTNSEYLHELRLKTQYPYVEQLTYWFERVHYGEYQIDEQSYSACKALFSQMRQTLKGGPTHD